MAQNGAEDDAASSGRRPLPYSVFICVVLWYSAYGCAAAVGGFFLASDIPSFFTYRSSHVDHRAH